MAVILPHTTRATGTVLTSAIYNADHQNHITNANSLNTELGAGINIGATTGIIVSNGAGVVSGRSIAVLNGLTVANANGVTGNPTIGAGALAATVSVTAPEATFNGGGQNLTLQSSAATVGPTYVRFKTGNGTNIGYVGTGGADTILEMVRNTVGTIRFGPGSGGTVEVTDGSLLLSNGGQVLNIRSAAATVGPAYARFQTGNGTNVGFIGMGGANQTLSFARNTAGDIEIDAGAGTVILTGGSISGSALTTVARTTTSIIAGNGLTGGGTLAASRTLTVGEGTGITVAATTVSVDSTVWRDGNPPTAAQLGASIGSLGVGAVGTYAFMKNVSGTGEGPGDTCAGSVLAYTNVAGVDTGAGAGSWRCMGNAPDPGNKQTVWLRFA